MSAAVALPLPTTGGDSSSQVVQLLTEISKLRGESCTQRRRHANQVAGLVEDRDKARAQVDLLEARLHNLRRDLGIAE